ncbi:MAG: MmcQ/YjbR family DNA-binding protein [Oscillospiraceae bacterium]|nr:MmcQ/YjbR family DNA-binding protein [Oscillospiraceae bacterium]
MNAGALQEFIQEAYGVDGERLFAKYPSFRVFRHGSNRKWFAVVMVIPKEKLGLPGGGEIHVVNVKSDPRLIGSFREEKGIYPAYHMSKAHWLTVALDGTVEADKIRFLLDISYDLTKGRKE